MKHLTTYKIFESRLEWKDTDLYKTILDIVSDIEDDGFSIDGLKKISNFKYDPSHPMGKDFFIGICKDKGDGRCRPNYDPFKISDIRNCINHLIEYGKENEYTLKIIGILEDGGEHNITNRLSFEKRNFNYIRIQFEKAKWKV